jgi:hypothetical protein
MKSRHLHSGLLSETQRWLVLLAAVVALPTLAADCPAAKEGTWVTRDFRFHTGEVQPELRLHYRTVGDPGGEPVLVLHGTTGSGASMLNPAFAGELFAAGQSVDARCYFIIPPDAIGTGKSGKPSDGLRAAFPNYNYDDMVDPQQIMAAETRSCSESTRYVREAHVHDFSDSRSNRRHPRRCEPASVLLHEPLSGLTA